MQIGNNFAFCSKPDEAAVPSRFLKEITCILLTFLVFTHVHKGNKEDSRLLFTKSSCTLTTTSNHHYSELTELLTESQ
jgi:hypothetical protein